MASSLPAESPIDLESVVITSDLARRASRPRDDRGLAEALTTLATSLADSPRDILGTLCELTQKACGAGSAGVSLLSREDGGRTFYWPAISGAWRDQVGGGTPRDFGPCGVTLERRCTQLLANPERYYPYIRGVQPPVHEIMLAPFFVRGEPVGTVWVLSHEASRRFDGEDQRQLESLASFAAAAWQVLDSLDTAERRRAEAAESMERLQATLSVNEVGTWLWDVKNDRVYADGNLARLFDLSPEQAAGGPFGAYLAAMHPEDMPAVQKAVGQALSGEKPHYEAEYRLVDKQGKTRWISARGTPVRDADGRIARFPGVLIDITERKLAEHALQEAARRKDEFLAMLAHELRNPLAPIRNGVRILDQQATPEVVAQVLPMMSRQVDHMVRLVDDLLDVSRVSRGKIELRRERVELAQVLRQVMEANRPLCDRLRHQLTLTLPARGIHLVGDATRLAQAFSNIVNNACKFTNPGGRISIEAEVQDDTAIVYVRDNGIGIAPKQLPHIFELFSQADTSLQRAESGLGIGLTLVRRLVEMHGGTVSAHSRGLGHGTEMVVRLPTVKIDAEPAAVAAEPMQMTPRRILVVDDNHDSANSLAMLLQLDGHEVDVAFDAAEALRRIDARQPELVVLDIGLPGMNGYEAARAIRAKHGDGIRLIALTGWGQAEDRARSREAGFDAHLTKPVDFNQLARLLV